MISIYTDGACSLNPGIGGWGAVIIKSNNEIIKINGGSDYTTNNKMELTATIEALKYFKEKQNLTIYTDSTYVRNGITLWIHNWKINNWKTANKKPVKNVDLWTNLEKEIQKHKITWKWIKGHAGNIYNEQADELARKYIEDKAGR